MKQPILTKYKVRYHTMSIPHFCFTMYQFISYFILSLGLAASGYFLGNGLQYFRTGQKRSVTVKGMAHKLQTADTLKVEISLWETGDNVTKLREKGLEWKNQAIKLVQSAGFKDSEISEIPESIQEITHYKKHDTKGNIDSTKEPIEEKIDFKYAQKITIISNQLELAEKIKDKITELNKAGVKYNIDLSYDFTQLDSVRPEMIAESLQSAQKAAKEFAKISGGSVGKIIKADQGRFIITSPSATNDYDNDEKYSKTKKIRVVSNVTFDLQ